MKNRCKLNKSTSYDLYENETTIQGTIDMFKLVICTLAITTVYHQQMYRH